MKLLAHHKSEMKIYIIRVILAALFLFIWFKLVDIVELLSLLSQIQAVWLLPVVLIFLVTAILGVFRLKILLEPTFPASFLYLLKLNIIGSAASIVAPANFGGFLRAYLLKKKFEAPFSRAFGFILLDFLFTLGTVFLIGLPAIVFFTPRAGGVEYYLFFLLVAIAIFLVVLIAILSPQEAKRVSFFIIGKIRPTRLRERLERQIEELWKAFLVLSKTPIRLISAFLLSLAIFLLSGISIFFLFVSFGVLINPAVVIPVYAIFGMANSIPAVPAKVGQYELIGLVIFTTFLDVETNVVAGVVLLLHILGITFSLILAGGLFLLTAGKKL